ncbi:MAG: membrane protein insertase YidC [Legionellales bacterium RIFCSPHIGHO2_12_FULL_35_11]|nr:MAG: membrane protein insertase YidC [Legionellales bacterium RIFCSPHIGHO2_12_FULL_35_11]
MDIKRVVLFGALAFVVFSLWSNWQIDYPTPTATHQTTVTSESDGMLPSMTHSSNSETNNVIPTTNKISSDDNINIKTDVLTIQIDKKNGNVVAAKLLNYPASTTEKNKPFTLLEDNQNGAQYVANSGLFIVNDQNVELTNINFATDKQNYSMAEDQDKLVINLTGKTDNRLDVIKTYTLQKGSYLIDMEYKIINQGSSEWNGYMNTQLLRSSPKEDKTSMFHMGSYTGASYSVPGQSRYKKLSFKDMTKNNLDVDAHGGWIAMQQHYFLTAWIPNVNDNNRFYTRNQRNDYTIGNISPEIKIAPGKSANISAKLYLGPEITDILKGISPGLDLTVDYGWLWFISQILFSVMKSIYSVVGNWGWAIVLVTVMIKLAFYRLSAKSYKSMAGMRKLQPKLQALKDRYGDDKAKMSQATMELYRQEKVNPLGGCLPILIQIPVFIALYWVLVESVELRQAGFIFWINDLASPDQYHVLPIIMGLTMFIQQKLNPAPPDPIQARVMMLLPVVFTILFLNFPAGLVLYWTVNNSLSILQQWYITRKYGEAATPKKLASAK